MYKAIAWQAPIEVFVKLAGRDGLIFFDSAVVANQIGRYSVIAVDPFAKVIGRQGIYYYQDKVYTGDPLVLLAQILQAYPSEDIADLPPFQGGIAGLVSYDFNQMLEVLPSPLHEDNPWPDLLLGLYDLVLGFDHEQKQAWIFSSGYPLQAKTARQTRAAERLAWLEKILQKPVALPALSTVYADTDQLTRNFTRESYAAAVKLVKEKIFCGDIFQANIAQRFAVPLPENLTPIDLYLRLRAANPASFAGYLQMDEKVIASASPERFIRMRNQRIETRPIKGTIRRDVSPERDQELARALQQSEKDRAENIMIVDLMRNDLSRVAIQKSVKVAALCEIESYATVHHLVSVVNAVCQPHYTAVQVLAATFPGGSVTGAPKIRAMEIISDIEKAARGPYCGSLVYLGFNGAMDSSILIRSYAIKNNQVTFHAGGAVVLDSDPYAEYEETLLKADALFRVLFNENLV